MVLYYFRIEIILSYNFLKGGLLIIFFGYLQSGSRLRNTLVLGRGLSSLGFRYKSIRVLSYNCDFPYEIIGFSESGSLLEFLSTRLLLYHAWRCRGSQEFKESNSFGSAPPQRRSRAPVELLSWHRSAMVVIDNPPLR